MVTMDLRRRAVLGAFLFNTSWVDQTPTQGFQSRSIWGTAPSAFQDMWPDADSSSPVAALCNSLVLGGMLYVPARVNAIWNPLGRAVHLPLSVEERRYQSPIFALTEVGAMYVLTSDDFDHQALIKLGPPRGWRKICYEAGDERVNDQFKAFINYTEQERNQLVKRSTGRRRSRSPYGRSRHGHVRKND